MGTFFLLLYYAPNPPNGKSRGDTPFLEKGGGVNFPISPVSSGSMEEAWESIEERMKKESITAPGTYSTLWGPTH